MFPKTPEHDKMKLIQDDSQTIKNFLEWLRQKYVLCTWEENNEDDVEEAGFYPHYESIQKILAEYFEIDLNKIEQEGLETLEYLRILNP